MPDPIEGGTAIQLFAKDSTDGVLKSSQLRQFRCEVSDSYTTDVWQTYSNLEPLTANLTTAPGLSRATFRWRYGDTKDADTDIFGERTPADLRGKYVRILGLPEKTTEIDDEGNEIPVEPVILWVGLFTDEAFAVFGINDETDIAGGDQTLNAVGLEYLLDRRSVLGGWCMQPNTNGVDELVNINTTPDFDDRNMYGRSREGNRSTNKQAVPEDIITEFGPQTTYVFSDDGEAWNATQIWEYVRAFFSPAAEGMPEFVPAGNLDALDNISSKLRAEGMTVFQILNKFIDPRRGLGWTIRPSDDYTQPVAVHVFSMFGEDVKYDNVTITGNKEKFGLDLTSDGEISDFTLSITDTNKYDQIIVRGQRILSCFSVSYPDGTLEKGWIDSNELNYVGYNDKIRSSAAYLRVFTTFRIPMDFDWYVGDGEGGEYAENAHPAMDDTGHLVKDPDLTDRPKFWNAYKTIERETPLPVAVSLIGADPEYRPLMVFVKTVEGTPPVTVWHYAHKPSKEDLPAMQVRPLDREFGIELKGRMNHIMAANHWEDAITSEVDPVYDWEEMIVTLAVRTDQHIECKVDLTPAGGLGKTLTINVPDAELWYIASHTVIDVSAGNLSKWATNDENILRDDTDKIRRVAALAKSWYSQERASANIGYKRIITHIRPGMYLVDIVQGIERQAVGTVVNKVNWNFETLTTVIQTGQLANPDFATIGSSVGGII